MITNVKKTKPSDVSTDALGERRPTKRLQLILQKESDEEEMELEDSTKFKVVSNKSEVDILYDSIKNNANLTSFKKLHFEKLSKEDKVKIEEAMYHMMWTFKKTPLEILGPIPRRLSKNIDQRWSNCRSNCIIFERKIREATLVEIILTFDKEKVKKILERHKGKFAPRN